jgi:hypothetical protein
MKFSESIGFLPETNSSLFLLEVKPKKKFSPMLRVSNAKSVGV